MKLSKKVVASIALLISSTASFADEDDAISALVLNQAQFSIEQAIKQVSSNYPGQIIELELDEHKGQSVYEIKIIDINAEQEQKLYLSLENGEVLKTQTKSLKILGVNKLDDDERQALIALQDSEFSLSKTLAELESSLQGKVHEFELENEKGITYYQFDLMTQSGKRKMIVDVASGQQIPMTRHD